MTMRPRDHYKSALIFLRICEIKHSLVAPNMVAGGRLVAVEEGVDGGLLVVTPAVHEAETIEGTLQFLSIP